MSSSSAFLGTAVGLGLIYGGRKALDIPSRLPQWDRWLARLWQPGVVLIAAGIFLDGPVTSWLDSLFLVGVLGLGLAVGWRLRDHRPSRWVGIGLAPYALYLLADLLVQLVGEEGLEDVDGADTIEGLSFCWAVICLLVARSQQKTLTIELKRREAVEQEQQRIEKQNQLLESEVSQRTAALARQTEELQQALDELKATQTQLIQAEKMASLGELTAGIAHEIQNPLNFVNNFAEVSNELVQELTQERARPTRDPALEAELLVDLNQNMQKITQHGQRAARIVRGMLEHSRTSTGERSLVDLNALSEEYLRLAYHGLRAKDKRFNATLKTDFASGLPLVEAVSQDVGRVLLNLFTNAFYAVQQRQLVAEPAYAPTVCVGTAFLDQQVQVTVQDNGIGIPEAVRSRIFQPFFTTKPSGEGTGLGLSLSHDIVVQGHGGTLEVASQEGQGTTFTMRLPVAAS